MQLDEIWVMRQGFSCIFIELDDKNILHGAILYSFNANLYSLLEKNRTRGYRNEILAWKGLIWKREKILYTIYGM